MSLSFDGLKQNTLKQIEAVLKKLPGSKHMLIDPDLLNGLDRCVSMRFLSTLGVKKVFKIQKLPPESSVARLVYVVPPNKDSLQTVIEHAEVDRRNNVKRLKLVAFVPKQTVTVKTILEANGLLGNDLTTVDLSFGWIPIDDDLISLNLPEVYTNYFLHGDNSWPYHFGQMVEHVLEVVLSPGQSPTDIKLHAFGSAAQVSAAGFGSAIGRLEAIKSANPDAMLSQKSGDQSQASSPKTPMFILFSRNLDYVTPFMVPTTFEALIHEVIGIDNGIIKLPNVQQDDTVPTRLNLNSTVTSTFKGIRDAHISTVHSWLQAQRSRLEDSRTGLGFSLTALDREMSPSKETPLGGQGVAPSTAALTDLSAQLKPILVARKELTALFVCFEEVMKKMAKDERVEDLLCAQTEILQSGSGGSLAMPQAHETAPSNAMTTSDQMPPEAATGACADDASCLPVRLALEWMSTKFGDRLTEGVRLLCLLSVTHDGLGNDLYAQVTRHIQHAVGFSILPLLIALRRLRLMAARWGQQQSDSSKPTNGGGAVRKSASYVLAHVGAEKLTNATERLIKRRKSTYNRLHRVLHLSLNSQVNLSADKPAVSPSYVFGGQHVPVVVRLVEALWAAGLEANTGGSVFVKSAIGGPELPTRDQLVGALSLLHTDERSANNLGFIPLRPNSSPVGKMASHGQTVVVVFVGGCTYAEVAALRFAAQRRCWRLLVVTSQMLSTKSIIQQVGQAVVV